MADQVTNYQCPACTGPLHYDGASGKLKCDYCGSLYEVAEIEALYKDKDAAAAAASAKAEEKTADGDWEYSDNGWGEDAAHMRSYNCPSCGAELICDDTTAATSCPYCGNPSIVPGQFTDTLKPDYVIPFKLDKNAAKAALKKFYNGKKLLPKGFASDNHIEELKGVYVPFWLYDGSAYADVRYHATRVHSYTEGNDRVTRTEHYGVRRAGTVQFERIPVDASEKMPDEYMDAVEPYNYDELKPFSTAYLPGYLADKYDVSADECSKRADERAVNTAVSLMAESVMGYTTCVEENKNVSVRRGKVGYALMPVWMLSTKWNGKNYLFAMNGQTGRLIGDLPISKGKFFAWFAGIAVPLMAVMALLFT